MSDKEIDSYWRYIKSTVGHILECLDGLDTDDLNWRPLDNANSLYVLATHTMANLEENLLVLLGGGKDFRDREEDFKVRGNSIEAVQRRWSELQERVSSHLEPLSATDLDREYEHPRRGKIAGRGIFMVVARHAAEHLGQAELTRDLLFTARGRPLPVGEY